MRASDALTLPATDWLRHALVVTGPAAEVAQFQAAARGAGAIPWQYPDADLAEEDQILALINPPDGSPGLRVAAARVLARELRAAVETHAERVVAAVGRSVACPLDLHALLPIPAAILRLGPDDPAGIAWLRGHWGVVRALRHVQLGAAEPDRRLRRSARVAYSFWSADWTPWAAFAAIRRRWPALVLDVQPHYDDD